jgi:hypothetical protein
VRSQIDGLAGTSGRTQAPQRSAAKNRQCSLKGLRGPANAAAVRINRLLNALGVKCASAPSISIKFVNLTHNPNEACFPKGGDRVGGISFKHIRILESPR